MAATMRSTLKRLEPMLGFRMKVVESAGTSLGNMLSNKNPWAGGKCGRSKCKVCEQTSESMEDCKTKNVLYESRCCGCNGTEKKEKDRNLMDSRPLPSIYVGESSRTLHERSVEHHRDYSKNKEDSHMRKHWEEAHKSDHEKPSFNQYVIKKYKSCLERQIGEAVRIQLRGSVLNSVGVYNRSKLTRLVVDSDWDKKVFASNWLVNEPYVKDETSNETGIETMRQRGKKRLTTSKESEEPQQKLRKKRKLMNQPELTWGEVLKDPQRTQKTDFLYCKLDCGPTISGLK